MVIPVIILNYNSSSDCRKCISYLKRQEGAELEIIIVDNCSPREGEVESIKVLCEECDCTFIATDANRGYNAGNNIGLRYAFQNGYKYAVIANPDMEFPQTDYFVKMVAKMEEDPQIAVLGTDIVTPEGQHQNPMRESTYFEELFWFITILRNHRSKRWFLGDYTLSNECEKVSGCCLMVRMEFIASIGFFDENVFLYCEEPILSKQVQLYKQRMFYLADAQAIHRHIKSKKGNPKKRLQLLMSSRMYYLKVYSGYSQVQLRLLSISKRLQKLVYKL